MSPDPVSKLAVFKTKEGIAYPLLSDPDLEAITAWGLVNPSSPKVPHPTAVIVDAGGVVRYFRQDVDYRNRPSIAELLEALDGITE